jgi:hypothetical protein
MTKCSDELMARWLHFHGESNTFDRAGYDKAAAELAQLTESVTQPMCKSETARETQMETDRNYVTREKGRTKAKLSYT